MPQRTKKEVIEAWAEKNGIVELQPRQEIDKEFMEKLVAIYELSFNPTVH